jgi:hypothetical protein
MSPIAMPYRRSLLVLATLLTLMTLATSSGRAVVSSATTTPNTAILANRVQVADGTLRKFFLRIPSLGYLYVDCDYWMRVYWKNSETYSIDVSGKTAELTPEPPSAVVLVADNFPASLDLGHGVSPAARQAAHVELHARQAARGAPCLVQAVGTSWSSQ